MAFTQNHRLILNILSENVNRNHISSLTPEGWRSLFNEADQQGIKTLIFKKLESAGINDLIPEEMRQSIYRQHMTVAARYALNFHYLSELLARFTSEGIPVIGLKGIHLAEAVYRDPGSRPMSDIDLLVRRENLKKAVQCCYELGFRFSHFSSNCEIETYLDYADHLLPQSKHYPRLIYPKKGLSIELHCRLTSQDDPFPIELNGIWDRSVSISSETMELKGLCPEDQILYLSLHGGYLHQFKFRLRGLTDISLCIRHCQNRLDWRGVQKRAKEWGMGNCLWLTLFLCRKFLETKVPNAVMNFLEPASDKDKMVQMAESALFEAKRSIQPVPRYARFKEMPGFRKKASFFIQNFFPSRQFMCMQYLLPFKSRFVYFYYPIRGFGFFWKWRGTLWKMMIGNKTIEKRMHQEHRDLSLKEWMTASRN